MYKYKLVIQSSYNGRSWHDHQEYPSNIGCEFISQELEALRYSNPNKKFKVIRRRKCV